MIDVRRPEAPQRSVACYGLNGLVIESAVELPTLREASQASEPAGRPLRFGMAAPREPEALDRADVLYTIPQGADENAPYITVARTSAATITTAAPALELTGGGFLLRVHDLADFIVDSRGERVVCAPNPGCPFGDVEQLLVDQIIPRVMHLRGEPCLHASAVALPGRGVVALLGPTGSGKSTTCALLSERGGTLVCDDGLAARVEGQRLRVFPGYPSLRLWPDSAEALFGSAEDMPIVSPRTSKRRLGRPLVAEPIYLERALVLECSEEAPNLIPLVAVEAVRELASSVMRLDRDSGPALQAEFQLLTDLAARVPVAKLSFRHQWDEIERLLDLVTAA